MVPQETVGANMSSKKLYALYDDDTGFMWEVTYSSIAEAKKAAQNCESGYSYIVYELIEVSRREQEGWVWKDKNNNKK
jgi:hypothetical protein